MPWLAFIAVFLSLQCTTVSTLKSIAISRTLFIGASQIPYYLPAEAALTLSNVPLKSEAVTLTILISNGTAVTEDSLRSEILKWEVLDDVFTSDFLETVYISNASRIDASAVSFLKTKGTEMFLLGDHLSVQDQSIVAVNVGDLNLSSGPYVLTRDSSGNELAIYKPYRLWFDVSQSFFNSVIQKPDESFTVIQSTLQTDSSPYIGAPSRVYALSMDAERYPLAGMRVSVKDLYYLKGLRSSAGNRHYYQLYDVRNATGTAVTKLIQDGAIIVGTTKMVQFANGDRATADWVDYHAPFSPRGDGNLEPSGSSTGAGTSIATLDFLDVSIGSDTGGSIRLPASVNGLYGIRPSVGAISLDEVVPLSPIMDTGGYISRNPKLFSKFGKSWYSGAFDSYPTFPSKVLLGDEFWEGISDDSSLLYSAFVSDLTDFLQAELANFSIAAEWNSTSGINATVESYLNQTYSTLVAYYQWTNVGMPFFRDFADVNNGRNPHINPQVLFRWQYGETRGAGNYTDELGRRETFENWTLSNFLTYWNNGSCSDNLYLYPINPGLYASRETYYKTPDIIPLGFGSSRVANLARTPEVVIPIGQVSYQSDITNRKEFLPVTVSIVARRGCDFVLLDLVDALADTGIIQTVKTGHTAF